MCLDLPTSSHFDTRKTLTELFYATGKNVEKCYGAARASTRRLGVSAYMASDCPGEERFQTQVAEKGLHLT